MALQMPCSDDAPSHGSDRAVRYKDIHSSCSPLDVSLRSCQGAPAIGCAAVHARVRGLRVLPPSALRPSRTSKARNAACCLLVRGNARAVCWVHEQCVCKTSKWLARCACSTLKLGRRMRTRLAVPRAQPARNFRPGSAVQVRAAQGPDQLLRPAGGRLRLLREARPGWPTLRFLQPLPAA
eukprot:4809628-Pleurochrysis_carterae.AAC.1